MTEDPFDCSQCFIDEKWNDIERASRGCTRTDLPPVEWDIDPILLSRYVGRRSEFKHDEPGEDIEEGCPGGWRYARFGHSVVPNARRRTETGDRVHLPLYDRWCAKDLVMEQAINYFESEQERCIAHINSKRAEKMREEAAQRAQKNK